MGYNNVDVRVGSAASVINALQDYNTVILKPNIVDNRNVLTQSMMSEKHTKYVIRWNYILEGGTVSVPEDCIVEFAGGTIDDGVIVGNNTRLIYSKPIDEICKAERQGTWIYDTTVADEEDITSVEGHLKFKDRPATNGMGKVILRKNKSFASQVTKPNTIYVIQYDFTLGEDIVVPENCVLEFDGGSINRGTLYLNNNVQLLGNSTKFIVPTDKPIIVANKKTNIVIDNLEIDCTQNTYQSPEYGGISIKDCTDITIQNCIFYGKEDGSAGFIGLGLFRCENVIVKNNKFSYFYKPDFWTTNQTAWATWLVSLKTAIIENNIFIKTYSGIKFTGWIENIQVVNNYSEDSITDGFDFAGISALNIDISNNTFVNNGDNGIEFKLLEIEGGHYDDLETYYGYSLDEQRYFKNITIKDNTLFGHRGIKLYNHFTRYQQLSDEETTFVLNDENIGNIIISGNKQSVVKSINPHSSYGLAISIAINKKGDCVVANNCFDGLQQGINMVSCCNIIIKGNNVKANNITLYIRNDSNRIDCHSNYFYQNQLSSNNGYCLAMTNGHNNIFERNIFTKYVFNTDPLKELTSSDGNVFVENKYGLLYNSIDRRFIDDEGYFTNILKVGTSFNRESGAAIGFRYFNTDTNKPNYLSSSGTPTQIRYRITALPTKKGYIDFTWVVDTVEKIDGQNPSIRINIDTIPKDEAEFIHLVAEQFYHSRWYMSAIRLSTFALSFCSKKNYVYMTPPAPTYTTDTGATFVPSYENGTLESWVDATGTPV